MIRSNALSQLSTWSELSFHKSFNGEPQAEAEASNIRLRLRLAVKLKTSAPVLKNWGGPLRSAKQVSVTCRAGYCNPVKARYIMIFPKYADGLVFDEFQSAIRDRIFNQGLGT